MALDAAPILEVVPGLHRIELGFVNAYLIDDDGELSLIDAGFPTDGPVIEQALASAGFDLAAVRRIVLTHGHIDHLGGAAHLRERTGARVLLSSIDAPRVEAGWAGHAAMQVQPGFEALVEMQLSDEDFLRRLDGHLGVPTAITPLPIDHRLQAGVPIEGLPGSEVLATPGHCAGHQSFLLRRHGLRWLFTGDAAVHFDGVTIAPSGEDLALAQESFAGLATLTFDLALFGHGAPIVGDAATAFAA